jgi:hypothetical protein
LKSRRDTESLLDACLKMYDTGRGTVATGRIGGIANIETSSKLWYDFLYRSKMFRKILDRGEVGECRFLL